MTDFTTALREAAAEYRRERERVKRLHEEADEVQRQASDRLAAVVRAAFTEGKMRKAAIIRATDHVWSRTWVDNAIKAGEKPADAPSDN